MQSYLRKQFLPTNVLNPSILTVTGTSEILILQADSDKFCHPVLWYITRTSNFAGTTQPTHSSPSPPCSLFTSFLVCVLVLIYLPSSVCSQSSPTVLTSWGSSLAQFLCPVILLPSSTLPLWQASLAHITSPITHVHSAMLNLPHYLNHSILTSS